MVLPEPRKIQPSNALDATCMRFVSALRRFSPGPASYLFLGVLILRLGALERLSASALFMPARGDMHFYDEWAQRILHGEAGVQGAFYGLPLYPYFLALVYKLFGYTPFVPGLLQGLADAATATIIYSVCLHLFRNASSLGENAAPAGSASSPAPARVFALIAAAGWGFYMPAQAYSIVLMPTAFCTLVFWWIVSRIVTKEDAPGRGECFWSGLIIGVSAMAVATGLFLTPLLLAAVVLKPRHQQSKSIWVAGAALIMGIFLGTSPCWIHNYVIARDPVLLSAHSGVNFWIGNNPEANGYPRFPPGLRAGQAAMLEDSITVAESAAGHPLKRSEVSSFWSAQAKDYIKRHPGEWLRLLLVKIRNFWNAFQYDDLSIITNLREQRVIFPGLSFGLLAALAVPGILIGWRLAPVSRWIIAAILLQMVALLPVFITERYRLPAVPGLLILGALGLFFFWRKLLDRGYGFAAGYVAILVAGTVFVSWPQRSASLWALDAYNSGWQALETGNYPLAEEKLSLAKRYVPTNPETNFALGNLRLAEGNSKAAADFYLTTLSYDGNHRGALNNLGVLALQADRYDAAEMWLRRAESVDRMNAKTHFLLAKTLLAKGERDAARYEADCAVGLRPGQPEFRQLKQQLRQE